MSEFRKTMVQLPLDRRGVFMAGTVSLTVVVMTLVTTAFWTASWLIADSSSGTPPKPILPFKLPFHKMGLWDICVRLYQLGNPYSSFSVLCEPTVKLPDFKSSIPGFIMAVEILYTIGFGISIMASVILIFTLVCGENYFLLRTIGSSFMAAGALVCLSVIIFAACASNRTTDNRMFQWEDSLAFGWSYWVAVSGGASLWICGSTYFIECRLLAERLHRSMVTKIIY